MITGVVLKIVLVAVALVVLVVIVRSLFVQPDPARARSRGIRRPRAMVIAAGALLALGLVSSVLGFGSGDMRDPVPFRIASVVLVVAGLLVLLVDRRIRRR